ncbi:biotin/lipoyl-containing protein, partial [Achromobacter xylosoxidans]
MAITDVVVPQLSESVSEATLLTWKKQPGAAVEADEILIEVETDKVVLEVPAPASGVLAEIVKGDGNTVTSGEVLARIDTAGKAAAKIRAEKGVDAASVAGTGRDGRVTKGDALNASAPAAKAAPAKAPAAPAPTM